MFNGNPTETEIYKLHRLASKQKAEGNTLQAIHTLKKAVDKMLVDTIEYSAENYLRLPLYMQEVGMVNDALRVLKQYSQTFNNNPFFMQVLEDKTRLILQRENRFIEAIPHGIKAHIYSLKRQHLNIVDMKKFKDPRMKKYKNQFNEQIASEYIINSVLTPLLKKAKLLNKTDEFKELVERHLIQFPKVDIEAIDKDVQIVINT